MITLHTDTADYFLHDNGMVYDAPESTALYGTTESTMLFDSLDVFLNSHNVTSISSEDGYRFSVLPDGVTNGDMTFNNLKSAIEGLQL